ncbi:MAG: hypothetical protein IKS78_02900 [Clostridia bacterium]|jgi:hypothetical protein|nr:hypothetical protein [Clostridia bacterium]MBR5985419.1 hypothetical protein [Clostridia bacterium]MBR6008973.1 hypothetical protein [Clostridia bacterium]
MRKTYSYSSVVIGVLVGLLVYASSENTVLAILAAVGVSVVGFILIRMLEKVLYKAADKAADKAAGAIRKAAEKRQNKQ